MGEEASLGWWGWWGALAMAYLVWHMFKFRQGHGPPVFPIVGSLPILLRHRDHLHDWITSMLSKSPGLTYQTYPLALPRLAAITVTCNPRNVEHILRTRFQSYPKGPEWQSVFDDLLGHGIFNSDGDVWLTQRKMAAVEFTARSLRTMMLDSISEIVHGRLCPILAATAQDGSPVDLQDVLLRFTFDNICHLAFGVDPASLVHGLPHHEFAAAFDFSTEATLGRLILPPFLWRAKKALKLGMERRLCDSLRELNCFVADIVAERRQRAALKDDGSVGRDLLSKFMCKEDASTGRPFTDKLLRDISLNFILAGRDTSSVAMAWFFWLVATNPKVETKLVKEIDEVIMRRRKKEDIDNHDGSLPQEEAPLDYDELQELTYMKAALCETLRLFPSVPIDTKYVLMDDTLPDGTHVKAGSTITYSIYAMGRMESIWGPFVLDFDPCRWLQEGEFTTPSDPYQFLAFNAGPRVCLGKDMAFLQMKYVAAAILRKWTVVLVPGHVITQKMSLTLFMKHGLQVFLRPRRPSQP